MIAYPPKPTGQQYGNFFPHIEAGEAPKPSGESDLKETFVTLHPSVEGENKPSDSMSIPGRLDFGVLDLWVEGGTRRSVSCRASFDLKAHGLEEPKKEEEAGDPAFNFLPGKDDSKLKILWKVYGHKALRSAKLELFGRGLATPVWTRAWGGAFGKSDAGIDAFPLTEEGEKKLTAAGELAWSEVKPDKALKTKNAAGEEVEAFPQGVLNLAHAPYQLRLTVSARTSAEESKDTDKFAFPSIAWTHVHVVIKRLVVAAGKVAWLDANRPDVDDKYRGLVVGDRGNLEYGREGAILTELKKETLGDGSVTSIRVLSNVGADCDDFETHKKLWGNGPRVPLEVRPVMLDVERDEVTDGVADVAAGASVVWDWTDNHPTRWEATIDDALEFETKKTREFLELLYKKSANKHLPKGSCNCPVEYGGKYGDANAPVFPPSDGKGALPFAVRPLAARPWAVRTTMDASGCAGVIFQPSRMAGDRYDVVAYLDHADLETKDQLVADDQMVGKAGTFEVQRERTIHHLKLGHIDGIDLKAMQDLAVARANKQVSLHLDYRPVVMDDDAYKLILAKVSDKVWKSPEPLGGAFPRPLAFKEAWDPAGAVGTAAIVWRSRADFVARIEAAFKTAQVLRVKRTPVLQKGKDHEQKMAKQLWKAANGALVEWMDSIPNTNSVTDTQSLDLDPDFYVLVEAGKTLANGAKLTGVTDAKLSITVNSVGGDNCCWGFDFPLTQDAKKKDTIEVKFPDGSTHTIKYKKQPFSLRLRRTMSTSELDRLRTAFKAAAARFDTFDQPFEVKLIGRNDSENAKGRITRLENVLKSFIEDEFLIVDKKAAHACFNETIASWWTGNAGGSWRLHSYSAVITALLPDIVDAVRIAHPDIKEGIMLAHFQRATNLTDLPERDVHYAKSEDKHNPNADKKDKKYYDLPLGAYFAAYEGTNPFLKLFQLATPDPGSDKSAPQDAAKAAGSVLLHEMGHALGIKHAPYPPNFTGPTADGPVPEMHLAGEGCIMDYHEKTHEFCGICRLRHRGWNWKRVPNNVGALKAEVDVSLGDFGSLFKAPATEDVGMMQRLQALGLFTRPVNFEPDEERDAAFVVARKHAAKVLGSEDLAADIDRHVREFAVERGVLPKPDERARLRYAAGWTPLYSVTDKMHWHPSHKTDDPPNAHDYWSLGAERGRVERDYLATTANLGAIPLHIDVRQIAGKSKPTAWSGARVFIQLIKPDDLPAYEADTKGVKVAGATSFVKGYGPPKPLKAQKFLTDKIDKHKPGASTDPQAANVHADLGGKRGLLADVISQSVKNVRNLFTAATTDFPDLAPNGNPLDKAEPKQRPNTVCVVADENGAVDVIFWPSLIAGDRYKLRVYVEAHDKENEILGEWTSGTMVRWRTVRIAHYLRVPGAKDAGGLPEWFKKGLAARNVGSPDRFAGIDAEVDFKGEVSKHLARSYNELLLEEGAVASRAIGAGDWTQVREAFATYVKEYPDFANNTAAAGTNPLKADLTPDEERKVFTVKLPGGKPVWGTVQIRKGGGSIEDSIAHDYYGAGEDEREPGAAMRSIETGAAVIGRVDKKKKGAKVALTGSVDYGTGDIRVEFAEAQATGLKWQVVYHAASYIDLDALLPAPNEMPAETPFLLPMRSPDDYSAKAGEGFAKMELMDEKANAPSHAAYINRAGYGTANVLLRCLAQGVAGNGQSLVPGIIVIQASLQDPYSTLWEYLKEGKGWGNVLFLFSPPKKDDAEAFKKDVATLAAHELGHCLYLRHAPGDGAKVAEPAPLEHDPDEKNCLMTYSLAAGREHCGACVANLRGVRLYGSVLNASAHPHGPLPRKVVVVEDEVQLNGD